MARPIAAATAMTALKSAAPREVNSRARLSPRPEGTVAVLPEEERAEPPVERPRARDRDLDARAERDVAAATEREVERRREQRRAVHAGVEGVRLLELERRHGALLVRTERQLKRQAVEHAAVGAGGIRRQLGAHLRLHDERAEDVAREELGRDHRRPGAEAGAAGAGPE